MRLSLHGEVGGGGEESVFKLGGPRSFNDIQLTGAGSDESTAID